MLVSPELIARPDPGGRAEPVMEQRGGRSEKRPVTQNWLHKLSLHNAGVTQKRGAGEMRRICAARVLTY